MRKCKIGMLIVSVILGVAVLIGCQRTPDPQEYTITYVLNGGTNHADNPVTFTEDDLPFALQQASRSGHDFSGWFIEADFSGTPVLQITEAADITLHARFVVTPPTQYNITYVLNGGTNHANNPATFTENDLPLTIHPASRTGYNFLGWFTTASFTGNAVTQLALVGNVTLHARFEAIPPTQYTITYTLNGGINHADNPATFTVNDLPLTLEPATRENYVFLGWFTNPEFTGAAVSQITQVGNVRLYASFEADAEYDITYILNGGVNHADNPATFLVSDLPLTIQPATKEGYTFLGWFANPEFTGEAITQITQSGDVRLYANFEIPVVITYHLDGGVNHADNPAVLYQSQFPFTLLNPTKDGYVFLGWFGNADFTGEAVTVLNAADESFDLFAKWAEIVDYDVTYHLDGGVNHADNPKTYNRTMLPLVLGAPTREGYIFLGWFNNAEFTGSEIVALHEGQSGDVDLFAKWEAEPVFNLNIELNGGTFGFLSPENLFEEFLTDLHAFLTVRGFAGLTPNVNTFIHGAGNTAGFNGTFRVGSSISGEIMPLLFAIGYRDFNPSLGIAENFFIYHPEYRERWLPFFDQINLYMIRVNAAQTLWNDRFAGGIRFIDWILDIRAGAPANAPNTEFMPAAPELPATFTEGNLPLAILTPRKIGHTFAGWFANSDFSGEAVTQITEAGHISLYAKWVALPGYYTIIYHLNGGTNHADNPIVFNISELPIQLQPAQKVGHIFLGWFDNAEFNGEAIEEIDVNGNVVLFANFKAETVYTISFVLNGGVNHADNPETFFGSLLPIQLQPATKDDHVFLGWFDNPGFTGEAITQITQEGNITLYANFVPDGQYTITYILNGGTNHVNNPNIFLSSEMPIQLQPATKDDHVFLGWFDNPGFTGEAITQITQEGNITLYANFVLDEESTITYVLNGGTNHVNNPETFLISNLPVQLLPAHKIGHIFLGWFDNPGFTGEAIEKIMQAGNITLYANFEAETVYTISYVLNGGVNHADNPATFFGSNLPITLQPASKDNYIFLGWFDNPSFTGEVITQITQEGNIALYANFEPIPADLITYVLNGGTWSHHTLYQLMTDFLTDVHTFMRSSSNSHVVVADLQTFIHGEEGLSGFRGVWQSGGLTGAIGGLAANVADALWIAAAREGTDQTRFFYNHEMRAKWLGFGDALDAYTRAINPAQTFWGASWVASPRLPQFAVNHFLTQPQAINSNDFFPTMPNLNPRVPALGGIAVLQSPWHADYAFLGWYTTADFQEGTRVTYIAEGATHVTLFARWDN